jgi:ureidoglycolate lyase
MSTPEIIHVPVVEATRENVAEYGLFIGLDVPESGLTIPFYKGSVEEGHNLPFTCHGKAVVRTARIHPRSGDIIWLERHMRMTQLFVGLGDSPLAMVLGKPNHAKGRDVPDLEDVRAFILPPGHGIMIHEGTWHDFPMALKKPVTVLTANSEEVVVALASQPEPAEMNRGDVYKIDILKRTGKQLRVAL